MPLVNTFGKRKKFPKRHTYSVPANSLRPGIATKESKTWLATALLTKVPAVVSWQLNLATDLEVRPLIYSWEDQVLRCLLPVHYIRNANLKNPCSPILVR